jgi:hypothetical protein
VQVKWYLASQLKAENVTTMTDGTGRSTIMQETIHQYGVYTTNSTSLEAGMYNQLVYDDASFAKTCALLVEQTCVMAQLLGTVNSWLLAAILKLILEHIR